MPIKAVLDSSTIAALYTPEEHSEWIRETVKGYVEFHILDLTFYEVTNALWKKSHLLREIDRGEASRAVQGAWNLSTRYTLTIYDASYLALAESLNAKLVTADKTFHEKLKKTALEEILIHPWRI